MLTGFLISAGAIGQPRNEAERYIQYKLLT